MTALSQVAGYEGQRQRPTQGQSLLCLPAPAPAPPQNQTLVVRLGFSEEMTALSLISTWHPEFGPRVQGTEAKRVYACSRSRSEELVLKEAEKYTPASQRGTQQLSSSLFPPRQPELPSLIMSDQSCPLRISEELGKEAEFI